MNLGFLALTLPLLGGDCMPPMPTCPAPVTFVKVMATPGAKTTWYPGSELAVATAPGVPVALRPGYTYRFELSKVGEDQTTTIWPSIEVRGSLVPRPGMNVADHPIPIYFTEEDIERILKGRLVSRIYYLEDPDKAVNGPQPLGVPLEQDARSELEGIDNARARGRLMIIVRAGERLWTREELVRENVPGTIWIPSVMKAFPIPAWPPRFVPSYVPLFDPLLGPKQLTGECLYDGGDRNFDLGIGRENKLFGLDPADTAMEFTVPSGRKVATSNRVCICVPRFAAQRVEITSISEHIIRGPEIQEQLNPNRVIVHKLPPLAVELLEQPIDQTGSTRASGLILEQTALIKELLIGPQAVAKLNGTAVKAEVREPHDITIYPDCTLILLKRVDPPHPKAIGEIVTFYLNYRNPTTQPMTDVVISDSLTARLEYIEGSAKSDRAATFTNKPNEAGSVVLRWVIDGQLLPGHRGMISFKARIR